MRSLALLALLLSLCTLRAFADPIVYTETFIASGELGTTSFNAASITLTFTGDTSNVRLWITVPSTYSLIVGTGDTTVSIGGQTYAVTDDIEVYDYGAANPFPYIDFGENNYDPNETATFTSILDSDSFACSIYITSPCYELQNPIGPIAASTSGSQSTSSAAGFLDTSGGVLTITATAPGTAFSFDASYPATSVTPEPSSLALLSSGLAGILGIGFKRYRQA